MTFIFLLWVLYDKPLNLFQVSVDYIADPSASLERVRTYARFKEYMEIYVNLVSENIKNYKKLLWIFFVSNSSVCGMFWANLWIDILESLCEPVSP